jgi:hypothetical protein
MCSPKTAIWFRQGAKRVTFEAERAGLDYSFNGQSEHGSFLGNGHDSVDRYRGVADDLRQMCRVEHPGDFYRLGLDSMGSGRHFVLLFSVRHYALEVALAQGLVAFLYRCGIIDG